MTEYNVYQNGEYIGYLVGGTLKDSLRVRLTVPRLNRCRKAALWSLRAANGSSTV